MVALPSGRTYELHFRKDIKPYQCLIRGCVRNAEIVPKAQRSQAWRLPARRPDDAVMGQPEWEFWQAQNFQSYCVLHKCDIEGCDQGMMSDETGCLFNMCAWHSRASALARLDNGAAKNNDGKTKKKKRFSLSRIVEAVLSTSNPTPPVKVQGQLPPKEEVKPGDLVRTHEECTVGDCQRLQIIDSRGLAGTCELHAEFPVIPDSVMGPDGGIPPLARIFEVDITGKARERNAGAGTAAVATAGALTLVNGAISILSLGMS